MTIKIDFSKLLAGIPEIQKLAEEAVLDAAKKITLDVHANVVRGSPVDSGEFRGKWTVETPNKIGDSGKITNTTPYGPALAEGHSPQAPDGWIENAMASATRLKGK
jgi:hypothetical protein